MRSDLISQATETTTETPKFTQIELNSQSVFIGVHLWFTLSFSMCRERLRALRELRGKIIAFQTTDYTEYTEGKQLSCQSSVVSQGGIASKSSVGSRQWAVNRKVFQLVTANCQPPTAY